MPVFKKWTDDEGDQAEEACSSEASEKRDLEPTPSKTPRALFGDVVDYVTVDHLSIIV